MKFSSKLLPKSELLLTIEISQEELETYENETVRRVSQQVEIPGFRPGQAPKAFVISRLGSDAFFQEVLKRALPASFEQAVKEKKLHVISRPEIKITSRSPLTYEARVALLPEITLKDIEKIKIPQEPIQITEKEIDEVIQEMCKYRATYKPLERRIKKGDRVEIDFQGFDEGGAPLDKTKSVNHPLFVGEGSLVPGFEDQLLGMKQGEKKKFSLGFPKDFHYEFLKGKTVYFETEIKRAEEPILPDLTEAFVESVLGAKKTVLEFREAVKTDIAKQKQLESRRSRENALLEKLLREAKLEVPPLLIEEEIDYMIADLRRDLENRGLKFETYLEKLKQEKKDLRVEYRSEAEKKIRVRLILNFLFRIFSISVTDEEMSAASEKLLLAYAESERPKIQEQIQNRGEAFFRLKNNLMLEKLFSIFLDKPS